MSSRAARARRACAGGSQNKVMSPRSSFPGPAARARRGTRKTEDAPGATKARATATAGRIKRRLFRPSPFLFATLLLFLAASVARPAAADEDGQGDTPVLKAAVGQVQVPAVAAAAAGADGGGEASAEDASADPPQGLYFFLTPKMSRRCFVVTEGKGSTFHVHYNFPAAVDGEKVSLELKPLSDDSTPKNRFEKDAIETKALEKEKGSYQFKIKTDGKYSLCAVAVSKKIHGRGLKLFLDLDTGLEDKHYERVKKAFDLDDVQVAMVQLKNEAQQMLREADLAEDAESGYHRLLLQLNHEVLWWPISQVVLLMVIGFYQVRHLKSFFQSKRLV